HAHAELRSHRHDDGHPQNRGKEIAPKGNQRIARSSAHPACSTSAASTSQWPSHPRGGLNAKNGSPDISKRARSESSLDFQTMESTLCDINLRRFSATA